MSDFGDWDRLSEDDLLLPEEQPAKRRRGRPAGYVAGQSLRNALDKVLAEQNEQNEDPADAADVGAAAALSAGAQRAQVARAARAAQLAQKRDKAVAVSQSSSPHTDLQGAAQQMQTYGFFCVDVDSGSVLQRKLQKAALLACQRLPRMTAEVAEDSLLLQQVLYRPQRPLMSFKALSWSCKTKPLFAEKSIRRSACFMSEVTRLMLACFFKSLRHEIEQERSMKPLAFFRKRRYDETPTRLRVEDTADVTAKVLQSELTFALLLKDTKTSNNLLVQVRLPTWLQCLASNAAECVMDALQMQLEGIPEYKELAAIFPSRHGLVTTDRHPSNFLAEASLRRSEADFTLTHLPCDVHKISQALVSQHQLAPDPVSSMISGALLQQDAGARQTLKRCLRAILHEKLQVYSKPEDHAVQGPTLYLATGCPSEGTGRLTGQTLAKPMAQEAFSFLKGPAVTFKLSP